ncbi:MAG: L-threonylcarbamoyladenylate synthase [Microthrixaceae bacterium]
MSGSTRSRRVTTIDEVVEVLDGGGCAGLPTDTVYGIAARIDRPAAVRALFGAKGRERAKAMAVLVADLDQAVTLGVLDDAARRLLDRHWPGPLTVVVQRAPGVEVDLGGEVTSIGIRCPAHSDLLKILRRTGPLVTSSANRSGDDPLRDAAAIRRTFDGFVDVVLDGGAVEGRPSTVVDLRGDRPSLLREGPVKWRAVTSALGYAGGR